MILKMKSQGSGGWNSWWMRVSKLQRSFLAGWIKACLTTTTPNVLWWLTSCFLCSNPFSPVQTQWFCSSNLHKPSITIIKRSRFCRFLWHFLKLLTSLQGPCEADHALALDADTIKTIAHLTAGIIWRYFYWGFHGNIHEKWDLTHEKRLFNGNYRYCVVMIFHS